MRKISRTLLLILVIAFQSLNLLNAQGELPVVKDMTLYSDTSGHLPFSLSNGDHFGVSMVAMGDIDGNGYIDIAVGAYGDDDYLTDAGAVYILMMDTLDSIASYTKLLPPASVSEGAFFGYSLANMGDMDDNGVDDLLVGAFKDEYSAGNDMGSVTLFLMNDTAGYDTSIYTMKDLNGLGSPSWLNTNDEFGAAVANLGDLDGNGVNDMGVSLSGDGSGNPDRGAVLIMLLDSSYAISTVNFYGEGYFPIDSLPANSHLGSSMAAVGDLDDDGVGDLVVGALELKEDVHSNAGAVFTLFLNSNGTVKSYRRNTTPLVGRSNYILGAEYFGRSLSYLGDINNDGLTDIAIGGYNRDYKNVETLTGCIFIGSLNTQGEFVAMRKYGNHNSKFPITLNNTSYFGGSCIVHPDSDGDGLDELFVGIQKADTNSGGFYRMGYEFLNESVQGTVNWVNKVHRYSGFEKGATNVNITSGDGYGNSVCALGDIDSDGNPDFLVGAPTKYYSFNDAGAVSVLFGNGQGHIRKYQWIGDANFPVSELGVSDYFGTSVDTIGDFDGNGVVDIIVGARNDDDGFGNAGAVYLVYLDTSAGSIIVDSTNKISATRGGFTGTLGTSDYFGGSVASIGDLDGDGVTDIAVGVWNDDAGATNAGAVYILFMNADGTVSSHQKISNSNGNLTATLPAYGRFGQDVDGIGDRDGDGNPDIIVSYRNGTASNGGVFILNLNSNGTIKTETLIDQTDIPGIPNNTFFGTGVAGIPDINGDGLEDFAVGAYGDDSDGTSVNSGAFWIICLDSNNVVVDTQKVNTVNGRFNGPMRPSDLMGWRLAHIGDMNKDGFPDLAVGSIYDSESGNNAGAVWMMGIYAKVNAELVESYLSLSRTTTGSYSPVADDDVIKLLFIEDYDVGSTHKLVYELYDQSHTLVAGVDDQGTQLVTNSPLVDVNYGYNALDIDLSAMSLSAGYYTLTVFNSKREKHYLKFRK